VRTIGKEEDFLNQLNTGDCVLLDGYDFDISLHKKIKSKGAVLAVISDNTSDEIYADLVINQTIGVTAESYKGTLSNQYFCGLEASLLRSAFLQLCNKIHFDKEPDSLLICFGGSDPQNKTRLAIEAVLNNNTFNNVHVVTGPGYRSSQELIQLFPQLSHYHNLSSGEMASLMERCEYGILPCSGILLESLAAGMKVAGGWYVDNQLPVYEHHLQLGNITDAGNLTTESILEAMTGLKTFKGPANRPDGRSVDNIIRTLLSMSKIADYSIRRMALNDLETTFIWANDPLTRMFSFNKDHISEETHSKWFTQKITDPNSIFLMVEHLHRPIGSIRFDVHEGTAMISYLVAPGEHEKGHGKFIMKLGLYYMSENAHIMNCSEVHGYVMKGNIASVKTFERFGFASQLKEDTYLFTKQV
jgi:spore coat polysaccharide biosynthesis predicted glycosyltransferase SpsG/RimJ/RimL family protein N-acetyltransferase